MEHIQQLALVGMQTFYLHIKDRVGIHLNPMFAENVLCQTLLIAALNASHLLLEGSILAVFNQADHLLRMMNPARADGFIDQSGQLRVGMKQPPPVGDAVRLVIEAVRIHLIE
ncbi:hypothetical protein D3C75_730650 [compost metagenome]